ncbi:MAG: hypothetical protein WDW38_001526 [Sanguina aurantia]
MSFLHEQLVGAGIPIELYSGFSVHNQRVQVLEVQNDSTLPESLHGSRILILDNSGNVHSMWRKHEHLTDSYWDLLACLPALVPKGPLALLGLGAGTIPRISAKYFPGVVYHGWELDPGVVMAARLHLGMDELEREGSLVCHTANALTIPKQGMKLPIFSGVVVDLFSNGVPIPALVQPSTWRSIKQLLSDSPSSARVMANLGEAPPPEYGDEWTEGAHNSMEMLKAMREVWDGEVSVLRFEDEAIAKNLIAVTGPMPSAEEMKSLVPAGLQQICLKRPWSDGMLLLALQEEEKIGWPVSKQ